MRISRIFLKHIVIVCLLTSISLCAEPPSYQVCDGSAFTVSAKDVGLNSFSGKVRVFIQSKEKAKNLYASVAKVHDGDTELMCTWKNKTASGVYSLFLQVSDANNESSVIKATDYFAVMRPGINRISTSEAKAGDDVTLKGAFFGRNPMLILFTGLGTQGTAHKCKIVTRSSQIMDPETGASELTFRVPNGVESISNGVLVLDNGCGTDSETVNSELAAATSTLYIIDSGDIHETSKYLARLSNFVTSFKGNHQNVLSLNAGDILTAYGHQDWDDMADSRDLYSTTPRGHAIFEAFSQMGFDLICIGNHDLCLSMAGFMELNKQYQLPISTASLFNYTGDGNLVPLYDLSDFSLSPYRVFRLSGIDIGVVCAAATQQDHWGGESDFSNYKLNNVISPNVVATVKRLSLTTDVVILVTHELDEHGIVDFDGQTLPYDPNDDIYVLKDIKKVAVILGGHEHHSYFRRAEDDSNRVLLKSSLKFAHYVGTLQLKWNKDSRSVEEAKMVVGVKDEDGNFKGTEASNLTVLDDDGLLTDDDSETYWWDMDHWTGEDATVTDIINKYKSAGKSRTISFPKLLPKADGF